MTFAFRSLNLRPKVVNSKLSGWLTGLIGMLVILFSVGSVQAQSYESLLQSDSIFNDTIDHLVITEWRGDGWSNAYIELTNMGDTAIDLRKFAIRSLPGGKSSWAWDNTEEPEFSSNNETMVVVLDSLEMSVDNYTLEPNEIFLMAPHYDELTDDGGPIHRPELVAMADYIGYKLETKELNDTSNYGQKFFRQWSSYPVGVFVATRVTDTLPPFYKQKWVLVDNVNGDKDPISLDIGLGIVSVAGFPLATGEAVLVRKHTITKGTRQDGFTDAASDDITTSEWIPIKNDDGNNGGKVFKTAGNHGNFTMDVTGGNGAVVDMDNGILEVPWGALKFEDIIDNEVILGDGMAWTYKSFSDEGDSLLNVNDLSFNQIAMPGDILKIFACGDDLETVELTIQYLTHANDIVKVFPTYIMNELGEWNENFYVTDDEPVIDTIGDVPFAIRIDTLLYYLDIPPNASFAFTFVGDEVRADLRNGDILTITGADGSTVKEYYIDVLDYAGSSEARLAAITWPDIFLSAADIPYYLQNGWASGAQLSDTIPGFSSSKLTYLLKLAPGTEDVPAVVATPLDLNAWVQVDRALDLYGSIEDRTTTITVTSEDSLTVQTYSILFEVFSDEFQEFVADPFFSTIMFTVNTRNAGIEVVNPGNVNLDLSNYMVVQVDKHNDPIKAIQDTLAFEDRYSKYIPGYVYKTKDVATWDATMDYTWTKGGVNINSDITPGNVFAMANLHDKQAKWWKSVAHTEEIDVIFHPDAALVDPYYPDQSIFTQEELDPDGNAVNQQRHVGYARAQHRFFLFRIDNPEILAGTKSIYDTLDFTLIDNIADPINSPEYKLGSWDMNGDSARIWTIAKGDVMLVREPDIYKGSAIVGENISEDYNVCQWIAGNLDYWPEIDGLKWSGMTQHFGGHLMNVPTIYVSTITSAIYIVSSGFEGLQDVKGVVDGTTVQQFLDNITLGDPNQTWRINATTGGAELGLTDVLLNSDTLSIAAADSSNFTTYILEVTADGLKDNARLTSTVYGISDAGDIGSIVDIAYGTTVKDALDNVAKDADAKLSVINGNDELIGINQVTASGDLVLRTVSSDVYFEVTAQDKVTKIVYQLMPTMTTSDAFVLSDVYGVIEWLVDGLTSGISVAAFYDNITVVGGESYIEDKYGYKRTIGLLSFDDKLVVISGDQSVTVSYNLEFSGVIVNRAPVIELVENFNATIDESFTLTANVSDDNLPEGGTLTYAWTVTSGSGNDVSISTSDAASTDVTISATGSYVLTLTVSDGDLESTASVTVSVAVGVMNQQFGNLTIYPNPTTDKVFVDGLTIHSKVTVYNTSGMIVDMFNANDGRHFVELGDQPSGTYVISVEENSSYVRIGKVVKQ